MSENRRSVSEASTPGSDPFGEICRKVVLLIPEDRLVLSHFRPLISLLKEISHAVVVITRSSGRLAEIEALGARVIDFDGRQSSRNPLLHAAAAWGIGRMLEAEAPDVVHLVALGSVVLGGMALRLVPVPHVVVQMPGLGALGVAGRAPRLYRAGALRMLASMLHRPTSYLLVDNADDLALLRTLGADPGARFAILGGAGIDPQAYPALSPSGNEPPVATFVGQVAGRNGIDVLMRACERLEQRGVPLRFELCGAVDHERREEIAADVLAAWCTQHKVRWPGYVADVREVWQHADICVLPARSGGGVPRALLEAAACARPLVVTDVPGCRHFVRDGIEGLIVPPQDAEALADALERLARDPELRQRLGEAARLRLLHGFTEAHVKQSLKAAYASMLGKARV